MKLSPYIQKINLNNNDYYYNTVTNNYLLKNSSKKEFEDNCFLSHQKKDAIYKKLLKKPKSLQLYIASTWSCTLRCPFCYVLHQLDNETVNQNINIDKLKIFIDNYIEHYKINNINITFLGGEPLSNIESCNQIIDFFNQYKKISIKYYVTSNLTIKLNNNHFDFLKKIDQITVSIDGYIEYHNKQRKNYKTYNGNAWVDSLKNIKKIIDNIPNINLSVQSALTEEAFKDTISIKKFVFLLKSINKNIKIKLGRIANTDFFKKDEIKRTDIRISPCCSYRYMKFFVLDYNGLYSNFFNKEENKLGDYNTPINKLEEKYKNIIIKNMPIFNDDNCIECPALGFCWGSCYGELENREKPSNHCNQKEIIEKMKNKIILDHKHLNGKLN